MSKVGGSDSKNTLYPWAQGCHVCCPHGIDASCGNAK
jgi:hypothetical protein